MATKPEDKAPKAKKPTAAKKTTVKKEPTVAALKAAGPKVAKAARRATKSPCRIEKCKRPYRAKGYCKTHYRLWRHNAYGNARYKECQDMSCREPMALNRHGYCETHYQSYYVKGQAVVKAPAAAAPAKEEKKKDAVA